MTRRDDQIDLCKNCLNINHCFYYQNQKEPIIFCEEFTCAEPRAASIHHDSLDDTDTTPIEKEKQSLCINCKQINSCNWDKTPVKLYCQEYE